MEKQYLDYEGFEHTIERLRRKEMPTASVDYVGQIVQYVGSTTASYTKGYYYECVSDDETPAIYSWVQRDIQPKESVKFNVLNYGVKRGNYPEENRDAFAQLLADVPNGATIYFPYGEYIFAPMNGTFNLTKDLYIVGDGLDLSIIKYKFQDTTGHHALSLNGNDINFMLSDIRMEIDFDSGDNIPSAEGQLINLIGTFNNILIGRVYLHTGGNLSAADMPTYNLIYSKAGCNNLEVSGCVFESLLNRHYGGCIWFSPYLKTSDEVLARVIDTLRIHDNLFRTTDGDEAIAVWEGGDATAHGVIKHCFIYDNTICHDDFNGTSFPTANIIAVYQNRGVEESIDCTITNNNILVKRSSGSSIIKIIGYNGVDVINNTIKIYDYCQTESSQTFMRIFAIEDEAVVNIKDNELISNVTTHDLWLTSGERGVSYVGNKIVAKNPNTYFVSPQVEVATEDMNLSIVRNDIVIDSSATNAKLVLYLGGTPTDAELRKVMFIDNHVDGASSLAAYLHGGKLYFRKNSSSKRIKYTHDYSQSANLVEWEDNSNIEFNSPSATPTYKIDTFVYHGYFDDLVFTNQQDSEETRNKYFNTHKVTFFDKCELTYKDIAKVYNVLDYGIVISGTTDNTAALQALIDDVPDGSIIYFPQGVYLIKGSVTINKNLKFEGESELVKPTSWKVAIGAQRPESAIRFEPTEANTTLFVVEKCSTENPRSNHVLFYGLTFYAQTRDETTNLVPIHTHSSSKADGIPFDGTLPYPVWTYSERIEGINGLDLSGANNEIGLTNVSNCTFVGFSGFAVKVGQHRYIENCAFYRNNTCIDEAGTDGFVKNCWFCSSHIGILISHEYFPTYSNVQVSSCWCDQMSGHFIYAPNVDASTVAVIILLIEDAWVDMIDGAAIYVEGQLHHSMISGRFSRCGMKWAGLTIDDRKTKVASLTTRKELMPDSDVICARIFHNNFVNISCNKRAVGSQSNNSAGMCPSKVIGVFGNGSRWDDSSTAFHSNVVVSPGDFNTQNMVDGTLQVVPDVIFDDDDWFVARNSIFFSNNRVISRIVRSNFSNILATANMPTASADYAGKIVQYAGEGTVDYKIGHFYVCKAQGTDPETYAWESTDTVTDGMYKVYSGNYDSVEGEFYDADGNALPKVNLQQYYDITTRTTWIYYSAWSGFFRLFNDVVGMEASQMNSTLMREYYPELNTAHFRCMNIGGNDGGLIEGFIYKLDRVSVTPETGDSPADEGWWEVDSTTGKMIQSTDTEVVSGKLYFDYVWTQVKPQQSVFPGTLEEWKALTEAEQAKYDLIASPEEASDVKKLFVIVNCPVGERTTISSGTSDYILSGTPTIPTGYTPIAVSRLDVAYGGHSACTINTFGITEETGAIRCQMYNPTESSVSLRCSGLILCVLNDYI